MIKHEINIGEEEKKVLLDITLKSKTVKNEQRNLLIYFAGLTVVCFVCLKLFSDMFWFFLPVGVFCLIGVFLTRPIIIFKYKKAYKKLSPEIMGGNRYYVIDEEGIEITSEIGTSKNNWNGFKNYGEEGNYIWLWRVDNHVVLINLKKLNIEEEKELREYLKKIK